MALAANRPREVIEVLADVAPCDNGYCFKLGYAHLLTGDFEAAAEAAQTFEACFPAQWWLAENTEVLVLAALGRIDEMERALDLLRQCAALGDVSWLWMRFDPDLEPLRDHPAFQEMLRPKG